MRKFVLHKYFKNAKERNFVKIAQCKIRDKAVHVRQGIDWTISLINWIVTWINLDSNMDQLDSKIGRPDRKLNLQSKVYGKASN